MGHSVEAAFLPRCRGPDGAPDFNPESAPGLLVRPGAIVVANKTDWADSFVVSALINLNGRSKEFQRRPAPSRPPSMSRIDPPDDCLPLEAAPPPSIELRRSFSGLPEPLAPAPRIEPSG